MTPQAGATREALVRTEPHPTRSLTLPGASPYLCRAFPNPPKRPRTKDEEEEEEEEDW
jgi:hypothetical protein